MLIELKGVSKEYRTGRIAVMALKDFSKVFLPGKLYAIIGRSGSGKSTLLHMIGGLDTPTQGKIYYGDTELTGLTENQKAAVRAKSIGFVFQDFYLESAYSSLDNVILSLMASKAPRKSRANLAMAALTEVGLEDRFYHKPTELSGGEKQRVAIARALVNDPSVVIADEPTGNLDSENGDMVLELLKTIAEKGKTVILVTHNLKDAEMVSDELIELKDGQVFTGGEKCVGI